MSGFKLSRLRYSTIFRFIVLVDMISLIVLWITGAYLHLHLSEIDQIVRYHFTDSIFDIILLASFKALVLFILISELENKCLIIISNSRENASDLTASSSVVNTDRDNLINSEESNEISYYKSVKNILHFAIFTICFASSVYCAIKFGFILYIFVECIKENKELPMDYYYFATLVAELLFVFIEFLFACLSWTFMRKLSLYVFNHSLLENQNTPEKKKASLGRLLSLSYPERYFIMIAFVMLCIASVTNVVVPYFFGLVVDAALKNPDLKQMNKYIFYMFLVFVGGSIAGGIRSWLFELSGQRIVARLRNSVFTAIIKQDIKFFDTNRTGELTSRISSDTQVLQNAVTVNLSMFARYLIQIVGSVVFMFSLQASLTGLLLAVIPVVTLLTVYYGRYLRKLRKKFQDELAASSVIAEEAISSVRTVRSFSAESKVSTEFEKNVQKSFLIGRKLAIAGGGFMGFVGLLSAGALSVVLWYGGKLVHDSKISTGLLASFLMYTLQVAMAFAFLSSLYGDFMQALGASQRIFELLDNKSEIPLNVGFKPKNQIEDENNFDGTLVFDDVSFTYPTRTETKVLKNISFKIEPGKTYALVGPSGGGKSTIFSLIERFYDPEDGKILFGQGELDIKSINTNWLHSKVALVSQEPVLFGGTIKENISFGLDRHVNDEEIKQVAKLANADEFIESFEKGYETVVGERGIRLSGGQKQRIAIARALLINPKLLLLDEATSALDSESEHLVQEAIDRAMKGRTVCIIAHRLSTVRNADKVMVLDKGVIVEQGTHQELSEMDGIYKRLVLRQLLKQESIKT